MTPATKLRGQIKRHLDGLKAEGLALEYTHYPGGPMGRKGEPDLHVTVAGRSVWIETKAGSDRLTKLQAARIERWKKAGAVAGVARSVEDVRWLIGQVT